MLGLDGANDCPVIAVGFALVCALAGLWIAVLITLDVEIPKPVPAVTGRSVIECDTVPKSGLRGDGAMGRALVG